MAEVECCSRVKWWETTSWLGRAAEGLPIPSCSLPSPCLRIASLSTPRRLARLPRLDRFASILSHTSFTKNHHTTPHHITSRITSYHVTRRLLREEKRRCRSTASTMCWATTSKVTFFFSSLLSADPRCEVLKESKPQCNVLHCTALVSTV